MFLVWTACNKNTKTIHEGIEYILVKNCEKKYSDANVDCESEGTSAGKRGQLAILDTESKVNALGSSFWYVPSKSNALYFLQIFSMSFC